MYNDLVSARLRVLVTAFGTVPGPNGHSNALLGMAQALRGDLDLVTLKTPTLAHQSRLGEARLFRVRVSGPPEEQRATFGRAVRRQLEAEEYDVVHVRGATEGLQALPLRDTMGFRFVYEVASFPDESDGTEAEQRWQEAHLACLEAADLVLVGAEAAAHALAERGFAGKVAVVAPGVNVDTYDWWPNSSHPTLRVLYLGPFTPDRDIPTLLAGLRTVAQHVPVRTLMAGEPVTERRHALRRMVDAFGLSEQITVRGEPRAMAVPSLIAACDVAVVSASWTPRFQSFGDLPEPLLEYLACGRPVVAAGVPAVSEVMRDEAEGLLYVPGDETSLADALVSLASDPPMRTRLTEAGYARVRQRFSSGARRRRIAEVYEMLLPGSQSYDAWLEGFQEEPGGGAPITGLLDIPASPTPLPDTPTPAFDRPTRRRSQPPTGVATPPGALAEERTSPDTASPTPQSSRPQPPNMGDDLPATITSIDTTPGLELDDDPAS